MSDVGGGERSPLEKLLEALSVSSTAGRCRGLGTMWWSCDWRQRLQREQDTDKNSNYMKINDMKNLVQPRRAHKQTDIQIHTPTHTHQYK